MAGSSDLTGFDPGLPRGTAELAVAYATRAADAASNLSGQAYAIDETAVLGHLLLPLLSDEVPSPRAPRPAPGGGFVHVDVLPDDEDLLTTLAVSEPDADAERVAVLAQECRLPVTPYRSTVAPPSAIEEAGAGTRTLRPGDVSVIDMTSMWAGPLCTMLLAEWGADVVTVEPDMRRDGLRGSPRHFATLDRGKTRVPWDLRRSIDRQLFEAAVRSADVLVESFSDRVMPNLGYGRDELAALNPRLIVVSIRAFAASSPEASWVAYGGGVHATSGLGVIDGVAQPAALAYPDPLAGLAAFTGVLRALSRSRDGVQLIDVSLAKSIAPLTATCAGHPLGEVDHGALDWLRGQLDDRLDGGPGTVLSPHQ